MAAITCKCGNRISNSEVPNDVEYHAYSDREWNKILENDFIETFKIPAPVNDVWKCNKCNRLYIFDQDGRVSKIYKVDSE